MNPEVLSGRGVLVIVAVLSVAAILAGCDRAGEPSAEGPVTIPVGSEPGERLTRAEAALVRRAQDSVGAYCRRVAAAIARGTAPSAEDFATVTARLDALAALAKKRPEAKAPGGETPVDVLGLIAENLEGTNCDSRLVARIDEQLAAIP